MDYEYRTNAWPIVHARTQHLDFRPLLLARPPWLNEEDFTWIKRHLFPDRTSRPGGSNEFGARAFPETLREQGGERWVYLRKDDLIVFGVLAVTTTLSVVEPFMTHEMGRSREKPERGRLLDAFVGFAIRAQSDAMQCFVPARDLEPYQRTYEEYLRPRWEETRDDPRWLQPLPTRETIIPGEWCNVDLAIESIVDATHTSVLVFPRSEDEQLWRTISIGQGPASLVLGMPGVRYAAASVFDIATVQDVKNRQSFERPKLVPVEAKDDIPLTEHSTGSVLLKEKLGLRKRSARLDMRSNLKHTVNFGWPLDFLRRIWFGQDPPQKPGRGGPGRHDNATDDT